MRSSSHGGNLDQEIASLDRLSILWQNARLLIGDRDFSN